MHITTADPTTTPGALLSPIHAHHAGLTAIVVRRKGADADLLHAVLHTSEGSPVKWKESPSDKPDDIARALWSAMRDDAATRGPGTYDVTLHHAAAEKGTPPKPIVTPIPVGHTRDGVDNGAATALYVAQFCAGALDRTLAQLPALVSAVGDALGALHQASADLLSEKQAAGAVPAEIRVQELENERERMRWERLERMLAGPLASLKQRMQPRAQSKPIAQAAGAAAAAGVIDTSAKPTETKEAPEQEIVTRARCLVSMLTAQPGLSSQLRDTIGPELHDGLLALSGESITHSQVLDVIARITVHPRRIDVLVMLDGPIADEAEQIAKLAESCA